MRPVPKMYGIHKLAEFKTSLNKQINREIK